MRRIVKVAAGWIHLTLILAILPPLFYAMGAEQSSESGRMLYFRCLLIALPVVATGIAAEKCRGALSYLSVCALLFAAMGAAAWAVAGGRYREWESGCYIVFLPAGTLFLAVSRFAGRLHRKREREILQKEDPNIEPCSEWLKEPSFAVLIFFCLVYALALNVNSPEVCNAALFSAAVYGINALLYYFVDRTEKYLLLNRRTCNLPSKRIYGIGSGMLAIFLLLLLFASLPAFLTVSGRNYQDYRERIKNRKVDLSELNMEPEGAEMGGADMEWLKEFGETKPAPAWMEALSCVLGAAVFLFLAVMLIKTVLGVFREFREARDENGDVVEELEEPETEYIWVRGRKEKDGMELTERERIRKQYRKFIRKHRKEMPAIYETPTEIETGAGIVLSVEGKELHRRYERARYGKSGRDVIL